MDNHEIGVILNRNKDNIAERIVKYIFNENKDLIQQFGFERFKLLEYAYHDLSKLFLALVTRRTNLFANYIVWQRSMLEKRAVPLFVIKYNLNAFEKSILEIMPSESHQILKEYIAAGKEVLASEIEEEKSFIENTNPYRQIAATYLNLILGNDKSGALKFMLNEFRQGVNIYDIYLHIIQPVQYEVGRLWQINEITVAQEHFATDVSQSLMAYMSPYLESKPRNNKKVVTTCIGGELHDMGIRLVKDFFVLDGWEAYYTGANTPHNSIIQTLIDFEANILAISATMTTHIILVKSLIQAIKNNDNLKEVKILVGGNLFNIDKMLWQHVHADGYAPNAQKAINIANKLISIKQVST